jgi:hypothetical protein
MDDSTSTGLAALESVKGSGLDIISDFSEVFIDSTMASGFLKELPIAGIAFKGAAAFSGIRDALLVRKITGFVQSLPKFSRLEVERFLKQHSDPSDRKRLGENIWLALDRLDDMAKCELVARAFASFVRQEINRSELLEVNRAIAHCLTEDLVTLSTNLDFHFHDLGEISAYWKETVPFAGAAARLTGVGLLDGRGLDSYTLTQIGLKALHSLFPEVMEGLPKVPSDPNNRKDV